MLRSKKVNGGLIVQTDSKLLEEKDLKVVTDRALPRRNGDLPAWRVVKFVVPMAPARQADSGITGAGQQSMGY